MKRIIENCSKDMNSQDVVKLRLRGKGSGFKEGPRQEESKEPLHLCVSSRFYDKYQLACNQLQELLLSVYEEYKKYCEKHRKDITQVITGGLLQIKKSEIVTGRKPQMQSLPNTFTPAQFSFAPQQMYGQSFSYYGDGFVPSGQPSFQSQSNPFMH